MDDWIIRRIVTCDEKWVSYRNPDASKQWLGPRQPDKVIVENNRFCPKVMCVWCNFEGVIHWELFETGVQSMQIFILNNWNEFVKFWDGDIHHWLTEIEFSFSRTMRDPQLHEQSWQKFRNWEESNCYHTHAYNPDLAPSDYHMFRSMAHFLRGRNFESIEAVEVDLGEFFASKTRDWYRRGIINLAERWFKTIESEGLYFEE